MEITHAQARSAATTSSVVDGMSLLIMQTVSMARCPERRRYEHIELKPLSPETRKFYADRADRLRRLRTEFENLMAMRPGSV